MHPIFTIAGALLMTTAAIAQDEASQKFIIEASVRNDVSPLRLSRRPRSMPPYPRPVARARSFSNPEGRAHRFTFTQTTSGRRPPRLVPAADFSGCALSA
jgi:hypothetical protein